MRQASGTTLLVVVLGVPSLPGTGTAAAPEAGPYEEPPVLRASDLAPRRLLQGPRHSVDEAVPTDGFMARFTVRSDLGVFEAEGREMLAIRVAEVYAIARLDEVSRTEVFATAFKESAKGKYDAVRRVVEDPVDTARRVPAGVGRFFKKAFRTAKKGVGAVGDEIQERREREDADPSGDAAGDGVAEDGGAGEGAGPADAPASGDRTAGEKAGAAAGATGRAAKSVFGYHRTRRQWAKRLEVDPYTTNPVLAKQLDDVAWAAFAGGFSLGVALPPIPSQVGTAMTASHLAWELPEEDIEARNDSRLLAMGIGAETRRAFFRNRHFVPGLEIAFVDALEDVGPARGGEEFVALAATADGEGQARFFVNAAEILSRARRTIGRFDELELLDELAYARGRSGVLVVPVPADHVCWSRLVRERADRLAERSPARRELWVLGSLTTRARGELERRGWTIREDVLSAAPAGRPR